MELSEVERKITNAVVERFINLNQSTPRKHLVVTFKPDGTEAVSRLVKLNILHKVSDELIPNAIAFLCCGDPVALSFAQSSVEGVITVLQHFYEFPVSPGTVTNVDVKYQMKKFWPETNPNAAEVGLLLSREMGFVDGRQWDSNQTGVQALSINESVMSVDAGKAWSNHIRQNSSRDARAQFHQGIFDLVEGRVDRWVTPMQRHELAIRLGIGKDDHDAIVRELIAEEIIKQKPASEVISLTRKGIAELRKDFAPSNSQEDDPMPAATESRKVFLVHGHNEAVKQTVARFLEKLNLEVVILHEQPNKGRTVIEKFEQNSDVGFAVVLMTPDDVCGPASEPSVKQARARQNVVLELGYFFSKLGRERVCAIYVDGVEIPSDLHGILYVRFDDAGAWRLTLAQEIKATGIEVDMNRALR